MRAKLSTLNDKVTGTSQSLRSLEPGLSKIDTFFGASVYKADSIMRESEIS